MERVRRVQERDSLLSFDATELWKANELLKQFDPITGKEKLLGIAFKKKMRPWVSVMKQRAGRIFNVRSGNLQRSIAATYDLKPKKVTMRVGALAGGRYKGYVAHILDGGTTNRTRSTGAETGKVEESGLVSFFSPYLEKDATEGVMAEYEKLIHSDVEVLKRKLKIR
ncbi:hypothetical protein V6R21_20155 [Limibacter armeniacum]|uniref:hypothetical protein n=1 Tax=Limibacter armeniacum TaxID=466084 RepID=UPI002FE5556B